MHYTWGQPPSPEQNNTTYYQLMSEEEKLEIQLNYMVM
jgi:hypothetical protein